MMYTVIGIDHVNAEIARAERRAAREGRQARDAAQRCERRGLLRLCSPPRAEEDD
jgi:hypothetical protein